MSKQVFWAVKKKIGGLTYQDAVLYGRNIEIMIDEHPPHFYMNKEDAQRSCDHDEIPVAVEVRVVKEEGNGKEKNS